MQGGLWACLALLGAWTLGYHALLSFFPYQLEPTEAGLLQSAIALRAGQDPWSLDLAPAYFNTYGIGQPWLAAQLSRLTPGVDLLRVMRLLSLVSIFAVLGLVYAVLRRGGAGRQLAVAAALGLYPCFLYFDTLTAKPDALAMALYAACLACALRPGPRWALAAGALAAAGLFVKPYALLGLLLAAPLAWSEARRRDVGWMVGSAAAGILALGILVLNGHPNYLDATLFLQAAARDYSLAWVASQLAFIARHHWPALLALAAAAAWARRKGHSLAPQGEARRWAWLALGLAIFLMAGPGGHRGAHMRYYHQLLAPLAFIVLALWLPQLGLRPLILTALLALDSAVAMAANVSLFPPPTPAQQKAWERAEAWVQAHPRGLYPPMLTSIAARHGAMVTDTDHTGYLHLARRPWGPSPLAGAGSAFAARIEAGIRAMDYEIVVCGGLKPCPPGLSEAGYIPMPPWCLRSALTTGRLCYSVYIPWKKPSALPSLKRP